MAPPWLETLLEKVAEVDVMLENVTGFKEGLVTLVVKLFVGTF